MVFSAAWYERVIGESPLGMRNHVNRLVVNTMTRSIGGADVVEFGEATR